MWPSPAPDAMFSYSPRAGPSSSFVTELTGGGYDITVFRGRAVPNAMYPARYASRVGSCDMRTGRMAGIFYGCSNYPYCEYSNGRVRLAGRGLPVKDRGKSSSATTAGQSIDACPDCDGWLEIRMGKYEPFPGMHEFSSLRLHPEPSARMAAERTYCWKNPVPGVRTSR